MGTGYRRSGDWQTGYVQRTPATDAKRKKQQAVNLEKEATDRINKQEIANKEVIAEANRIFKLQTGIDSYEAAKASQFSQTFQTFMTKTVASIVKDLQDEARAKGAADAAQESEQAKVIPEDPPEDPPEEDKKEDEVTKDANQLLNVATQSEKKLATKLENAGQKEAAQKARGLFSGAYDWGWKIQTASQQVAGFDNVLDTELSTNETYLQIGDEEPWQVKDSGDDKTKLKYAANYILKEWLKENGEGLNTVALGKLLAIPARKKLNANLATRYEAIDLEFNQNQIAGINNSFGASLQGIPGSANIFTNLATYNDRIRPYLEATETKGKGTLVKENLQTTFINTIGSADAQYLENVKNNMIRAATELSLDTPMGAKTLAQIDPAKFSKQAIEKVYYEELNNRFNKLISGQKAGATIAILEKKNELKSRMIKDPTLNPTDFAVELESFEQKLIKEFPYAKEEINDLMGDFEVTPLDTTETLQKLENAYEINNGVITEEDLDNVDLETAKAFLKDKGIDDKVEKVAPSTIDQEGTDTIEKAVKATFSNAAKNAGITNSLDLMTIEESQQASAAIWDLHQLAKNVYYQAREDGKPISYTAALRSVLPTVQSQIQAEIDGKDSRYFKELGTVGAKETIPRYGMEDTDLLFQTLKYRRDNPLSLNSVLKKDWGLPVERLQLDDQNNPTDPLVKEIARRNKVSGKKFVESQLRFKNVETEPDEDQELIDGVEEDINNSEAGNVAKELNANDNASGPVTKRMLNDSNPLNPISLGSSFTDFNGATLDDEVTDIGLTLDAGEAKTIGDDTFVGHRFIGMTEPYGWRTHPTTGEKQFHTGVDIGTSGIKNYKTALHIEGGTVTNVESLIHHGLTVTITDAEGVQWKISHLKDVDEGLNIGDVYNGRIIGTVGNTGRSTGEHVHLEKWVDGEPVDPTEDLDILSMGRPNFVGKFPVRRHLIKRLTKEVGQPLKGSMTKVINDFENNPNLQQKVWNYINEKEWPKAMEASGGDEHLAVRFHAANILTGDMNNYQNPAVWDYGTKYIHNLRTQGVLD